MANLWLQIFLKFIATTLIFSAFICTEAVEVETVKYLFVYQEHIHLKPYKVALDFLRNSGKPVIAKEVGRMQLNETDKSEMMGRLCNLINKLNADPKTKFDFILDFTKITFPSDAIKNISRVMNIPTISGTFGQDNDVREWKELSDKQKNYLIAISPPADVVPQVMRSLVSHQDMTAAALMFAEEDYEMYHKYKALIQNLPCRHLLTKLERTTQTLRKQLDRLIHVDLTSFFIAAVPNEISGVLAEASDPEMRGGPYFSDEFAWYSWSMVPGFPKCTGCRDNVSVIHISPKYVIDEKNPSERWRYIRSRGVFKHQHLTDLFYFDITVDAILAVAKMKSEKDWNTTSENFSPNKCMETTTYDDELELDLYKYISLKEIQEENLLGPFVFDDTKEVGRHYAYIEMTMHRMVFKPKQQDPETFTLMGVWKSGFTEKDLVHSEEGREADWKAHNILTVFRVVTVVQPPFVYKTEGCVESKEDKYSRCFTGYCIDLLDRMQRDLGFNYTIRNVSKYGYMGVDEPHEWDGMVRELKDRKADIALGAMSVMAERESVVDYTVPYYDLVGITILMRKPVIHTSLFKFLTVLTNEVWFVILTVYFLTSGLMYIFDRWSPYSFQNDREYWEAKGEEEREFSFKECLWFAMTSLTPQGGGEAPKNLSGRIVAASWWLFGFIVIASYTANLAAFLTVSRLDNPIESLEDLAKQYKVQYAPQMGSTAWIYFNRMANIEYKFYELWRDLVLNDTLSDYERALLSVWDFPVTQKHTKILAAMKENGIPEHFDEAVKRVRGEDPNQVDAFAFLADATDLRWVTNLYCDVKIMGEEFSRKPYAIAVQQGSPLKDLLNDSILKLLNERYLEGLKETWWTNNRPNGPCPKEEPVSDGISIHNIGGVFIVIFVGIILACCTLLFEYYWNKKKDAEADPENAENTGMPTPREFLRSFTNPKPKK